MNSDSGKYLACCGAIVAILTLGGGCRAFNDPSPYPSPVGEPNMSAAPHELKKTVLPAYVIEPPDLLTIEAIHAVPKQPYHLQSYDSVVVQVEGTPAEAPISGVYPVGADGTIVLGVHYGSVYVAGKTVEEAKAAVAKLLATKLSAPDVSVSLADSAARQRISGPHLVGMDGTVTLGTYGNVSVIGLTISQAKAAVEQHLLQFFDSLEVSVEIGGYNSKVYYVVTQGAGFGDGVYRFPMTGNETVLDALSQINGLRPASSKKIWIARPTDDPNCVERLEVNWEDITANAFARSNYQVLPGDRIFVAENHLIALDTSIGYLLAPVERVMGFSIFGAGTVTRFSGAVLSGGGNANAAF